MRRPSPRSVAAVLRDRPYLRWDLVPLAAYLFSRGYFSVARNRIVDAVAAGNAIPSLVPLGLRPADVAGCTRALHKD